MVGYGKQTKDGRVGVVWIGGGLLVPVLGKDRCLKWLGVGPHDMICCPGVFWSI